jgi:hypothetical protein
MISEPKSDKSKPFSRDGFARNINISEPMAINSKSGNE